MVLVVVVVVAVVVVVVVVVVVATIEQALRGGYDKMIVRKKFGCQLGNDTILEMLSIPCIFVQAVHTYANIQKYFGRIPPKVQHKTHFSLVSLGVYPR